MNDAARQRIDTLAKSEKTKNQLLEELEQIHNMSLLLHCSAEVDWSALRYMSYNGMVLGEGKYAVVLFSISNCENADGVNERRYLYSLLRELGNQILRGRFLFYSAEIDGRLTTLFNFSLEPKLNISNDSMLNEVKAAASEICQAAFDKYQLKVFAYVSDIISRVQTIAMEYHALINTLTLHKYLGREPVGYLFTRESPMPKDAPEPVMSETAMAANIANAIVRGDENYRDLGYLTMKALTEEPFSTTEELREKMSKLITALCRNLIDRGVEVATSSLRLELFHLWRNQNLWADVENWFIGILDTIYANSSRKNNEFVRSRLDFVCSYIVRNLSNANLTVKEISHASGLSSGTLVKEFREQLQLLPSEYIHQKRMERALELVKTTSLPVKDVCAQCGFGSTETFYRNFKKYYGITPLSIRKQVLASEEYSPRG